MRIGHGIGESEAFDSECKNYPENGCDFKTGGRGKLKSWHEQFAFPLYQLRWC